MGPVDGRADRVVLDDKSVVGRDLGWAKGAARPAEGGGVGFCAARAYVVAGAGGGAAASVGMAGTTALTAAKDLGAAGADGTINALSAFGAFGAFGGVVLSDFSERNRLSFKFKMLTPVPTNSGTVVIPSRTVTRNLGSLSRKRSPRNEA